MAKSGDKAEDGCKTVATNRRAFHDYHMLEKMEAGLELTGPEVKSVKEGKVSLGEAYAMVDNGEARIHSLHILPYSHSRAQDYNPVRPRRLLLHKEQIHRLIGQTQIKGHTLIPLRVYLKKGWIKVELALARGKQAGDKRETIKRKTHEREVARAIAGRVRR